MYYMKELTRTGLALSAMGALVLWINPWIIPAVLQNLPTTPEQDPKVVILFGICSIAGLCCLVARLVFLLCDGFSKIKTIKLKKDDMLLIRMFISGSALTALGYYLVECVDEAGFGFIASITGMLILVTPVSYVFFWIIMGDEWRKDRE